MTIISVVYVPEGIAMSADSRLTNTRWINTNILEKYTITDNAQKLVLIRDSSIGVSFCGDAILEGKTISDVLRIFDINHVQVIDTVEVVATKLKNYLQTFDGTVDIDLLMAGYDEDNPYIYSVSPKETVHLNIPGEPGEYGAQWRGQTVPVGNAISNIALNTALMPLKDAADFAEFIVDFTIKYQRFDDRIATCGGAIDLLIITKDYSKFLRHKIL